MNLIASSLVAIFVILLLLFIDYLFNHSVSFTLINYFKKKTFKLDTDNKKEINPSIFWIFILTFFVLSIIIYSFIYVKNNIDYISRINNNLTATSNENTPIDNSKISNINVIGTLTGGILGPVVAFLASLFAGLAFYSQYYANRQVQRQFKLQQFENQFNERLKLLKEEILDLDLKGHSKNLMKGRTVFYELNKEINLCFYIINLVIPNATIKNKFSLAYNLFYSGRKSLLTNYEDLSNDYKNFLSKSEFNSISNYTKSISKKNNPQIQKKIKKLNIKHLPFKGMYTKLSLIFRQIFGLVKFVVNNKNLNYKEKRDYLRILRSILGNYEQLHIFYNWYGDISSEWEDDNNSFLVDYRMIHNLPISFLISDIEIDSLFKEIFLYEKDKKESDSLFEIIEIYSKE